MAKSEDEMRREAKKREIDVDHKNWKDNAPFLYDMVMAHPLEWSSLTVEWLPDREEPAGKEYSVQKLILGTYTSGDEPNYLMIAEVHLPPKDAEYSVHHYDDSRPDLEGFGITNGKVEIMQKINHGGEINRARYNPQNPFVIATKAINGEVYLFDYSNHPSEPPSDKQCRPDLRLKGHTKEGYGLSWSKFKNGHLLSGSDDTQICLWDVNATTIDKTLDAMQIFKIHEGVVQEVAWHLKNENLFGSVGYDKYLHICDLRSPTLTKPTQSLMAHQREVMSLAFNPFNEFTLATGSADKTVKIFDLRKFTTAIHTFNSHKNAVYQVGWSPKNESVLASSCLGRRVMLWDISRIGTEQGTRNAKDGPPELVFVHGGHTSKVLDFSWNQSDDWVIASVAQDNMVQIWKMADKIQHDDDDDDDEEDDEADLHDDADSHENQSNVNKRQKT